MILEFCRAEQKLSEIQKKLGYANRTKFRRSYIDPLLTEGLLEKTDPDTPTSPNQCYRITEAGIQYLQNSDI
jgi:predicted transcriptional regulator